MRSMVEGAAIHPEFAPARRGGGWYFDGRQKSRAKPALQPPSTVRIWPDM